MLVLALAAFTIVSCKNEKPSVVKTVEKNLTPEGSVIVADSLTYSLVTHSSEDVDATDGEEFKSFLHEKLINYIFEQLYDGKLKAYDFYSDKEMTIKEIKEIEKSEGFSRSKVGKVQFNDQWYFDNKGVLNKRTNSMTFGLESYSNAGSFIGYKALFKIKF
jgi:hypothetical protein